MPLKTKGDVRKYTFLQNGQILVVAIVPTKTLRMILWEAITAYTYLLSKQLSEVGLQVHLAPMRV